MRPPLPRPYRAIALSASLAIASCHRAEDPSPPSPEPVVTPAPAADPTPAPPPPPQPRTAPTPPKPLRSGPTFSLPTDNKALFSNDPATFFMFVDRYKDGITSQVWEGGSYGFVRNARTTAHGEVFTKFHEGIDIAPVARDPKGEPTDPVRAIADGTVVYTLKPPLTSNYGNYLVVAHPCGPKAGTYYSLYAHLHHIETTAGTTVRRGDQLGIMGHTGAGIDRRRSHLHLEIAFLLTDRFDDYYTKHNRSPNGHGNFHGSNLTGIDAAAFLLAAHRDPGLTPADFLKNDQPLWRALVPCRDGAELDIVRRYPWLRLPGPPSASWEISLNGAGVPLSISPSPQPVQFPAVSWVRPSPTSHSWASRNLLSGSGNTATLATEGARYLQLLSGDF
jgi:murein DD-endopeptidase MepM/ murein hydrolase activator NlpD